MKVCVELHGAPGWTMWPQDTPWNPKVVVVVRHSCEAKPQTLPGAVAARSSRRLSDTRNLKTPRPPKRKEKDN